MGFAGTVPLTLFSLDSYTALTFRSSILVLLLQICLALRVNVYVTPCQQRVTSRACKQCLLYDEIIIAIPFARHRDSSEWNYVHISARLMATSAMRVCTLDCVALVFPALEYCVLDIGAEARVIDVTSNASAFSF